MQDPRTLTDLADEARDRRDEDPELSESIQIAVAALMADGFLEDNGPDPTAGRILE